MANKSAKKQAIANAQTLKLLHAVSAGVNLFYLAVFFIFKRPGSIKPYLFCSLPAFLLQYQLERMGRPKFDAKGTLVSAGDDLAQAGLTEWFHDVIYLTWICDVLAPITGSNKIWYLYFAIPIYASYKVYTLFIASKGGLFNSARQPQAAPVQSKRQEKMERNANKVRYV